MSNPLFNMMNQNGMNNLPGNLGNLSNFINSFNSFKQMLGSNPGHSAEQMVRQMLSSGRITQEQFNQVGQLASTVQKMTGL